MCMARHVSVKDTLQLILFKNFVPGYIQLFILNLRKFYLVSCKLI